MEIKVASEHSAGCHTLNGADPEKMPEAGGSEQCRMAHPTEEGRVRQLSSDVGVFDGGFAHCDGEDVADDHDQGHLG